MKLNRATLLGLSIWLVLIGGVIVYGAYTSSLNESNVYIVINALVAAAGVISFIMAIQCFLWVQWVTKYQQPSKSNALNIYK